MLASPISKTAGTEITKHTGFAADPDVSAVWKSVLRDDGATELVVHPNGDHVDILDDPIDDGRNSSRYREGIICVPLDQPTVFDAGRPVRFEAVFESTTPTVRRCIIRAYKITPETLAEIGRLGLFEISFAKSRLCYKKARAAVRRPAISSSNEVWLVERGELAQRSLTH